MLLFARITDLILIADCVVFLVSANILYTTYLSPLKLIADFNPFILSNLLFWGGITGCVLHSFDILVCWLNTQLSNRKGGRHALMFFLLLKLVMFGGVLYSLVVVIMQTKIIQSGMEKGYLPAMKEYSTKPQIKENMDILQLYLSCCGNTGYQDWYNIDWIAQSYKSPKGNQEKSVPFSCCDRSSNRPCAYLNAEKDPTTISKKGCRTEFSNSYGSFKNRYLLAPIIVAVVAYFVNLLLTRYAQTSINDAIEKGHAVLIGYGYLIGWGVTATRVEHNIIGDVRKRRATKAMLGLPPGGSGMDLSDRLSAGAEENKVKWLQYEQQQIQDMVKSGKFAQNLAQKNKHKGF